MTQATQTGWNQQGEKVAKEETVIRQTDGYQTGREEEGEQGLRGKEGNAWGSEWEAGSDSGEQREAGDQDRWQTGKRRCRGGNQENRPLSWEDGPEADKEVAYTDRGMDSGAGGLLLNLKNGDVEMLGHRGKTVVTQQSREETKLYLKA